MSARTDLAWSLDPKDELYKLHGSTFGVPRKLFESLYSYQRDAVAWAFTLTSHAPPRLAVQPPRVSHGALASLRAAGEDPTGKGAILADDMGLGKSVQSVAFIAGLFHSDMINAALIVAPVSVLPVWEDAFKKFAPELRVRTYHGASVPERVKAMRAVQTKGGVLITSYGMISSDPVAFGGQAIADSDDAAGAPAAGAAGAGAGAGGAGKRSARKPAATPSAQLADLDISFDVVILDEAHTIKNTATKAARALRTVPADFRFLLTGTPIQNNLEELWSLMDFAMQGTLLGTRRVFNKEIGDFIVAGRDRLATPTEKAHAAAAAQLLTQLVAPYILRREKATVFGGGGSAVPTGGTAAGGAGAADDEDKDISGDGGADAAASKQASPLLSEKKEVVLWTRLSALQLHLYRRFLESPEVAAVLNRTTSPLAAITTLKQLACHPLLLKSVANGTVTIDNAVPGESAASSAAARLRGDDGSDDDGIVVAGRAAAAAKAQRKPSAPSITSAEDAKLQNLAAQQLSRLRARPSATGSADRALTAYSDFGAFFRAASTEGASAAGSMSTSSSSSAAGASDASAAAEWPGIGRIDAGELVAASGKLQVLVELLRTFHQDGNKVLIFSSSLRLLDVIESLLRDFPAACAANAKFGAVDAFTGASGSAPAAAGSGKEAPRQLRYARIDGTLADAERRPIVKQFNEDPKLRVCLLSTGVGALGLTLTGADRVIICDPSWNPAVDSQAVDRAYRIGQTRNVVTYRLVAAGTIEEKMYRRQIFKGGLTQSVMAGVMRPGSVGELADGELTRFLSAAELKDVFTLGATDFSETQRMVDAVCTPPAPRADDLRTHVAALESGPVSRAALGMSHHDHLFSLDPATAKRLQEMAQRAKTAAAAAAMFGGPGSGAAAGGRGEAGAADGKRRRSYSSASCSSSGSDADSESDGDAAGGANDAVSYGQLSDSRSSPGLLDSPSPPPAVRRSGGSGVTRGSEVIDLTGGHQAAGGGGTIDLTAVTPAPARLPRMSSTGGAGSDGECELDDSAEDASGPAAGPAEDASGVGESFIDLLDTPPRQQAVAVDEDADGDDDADAGFSSPGYAAADAAFDTDSVAEQLATDLSRMSVGAGGGRKSGESRRASGMRRSTGDELYSNTAFSPAATSEASAAATPATVPSQTPPRTVVRGGSVTAIGAAVPAAAIDAAAISAAAGVVSPHRGDLDDSAAPDDRENASPAGTVRVSICSPLPRTAVRLSSAAGARGNRISDASFGDDSIARGGKASGAVRTPLGVATTASTEGLATPANVCPRHWSQMLRCGLPRSGLASAEQCECALSPESRELAALGVEQAEGLLKGSSPASPAAAAEALKLALDALVIRDADPTSHLVAMRAAHALGLLRA